MRRSLLALLLWLFTAPAWAGVTCTLPFNLQNNITADATQVMANYNALVTCLTNAAHSGANSDITSLTGLTTPLVYTAGGSSAYIGSTSTGSANAQVVATPTPIGFSLTAGFRIVFIAGFTNSGATTLNVNSTGATNVYRTSPGGPVALAGGEIVAGNLVEAFYDGTQYEILTSTGPSGGVGTQTSIASASPTDLSLAVNHNALITGTATINSFSSNASTVFPLYWLKFNAALTLTYNATSMILPGTGNITTAANDTAVAMYLGSGNWQIVMYQRANGTAVVNPTPLCGAVGLKIFNNAATPNTSIDYSADSVVMINPTGNVPVYRTAVSGTIVTTSTNVINGIDAARANSTWYNIYLMDNGSTTGGYASTSATGSFGTTPSGYTFYCRLGTMRTDSSGNFYRTLQYGSVTQYTVVTSSNVAQLPVLATGIANTYSDTTPTLGTVTLSGFVPPTAVSVGVVAQARYQNLTGPANVLVAPTITYGGTNNGPNGTNGMVYPIWIGATRTSAYADIVLEAATIAWASDAAGGVLSLLRYKDKVNAN